MQRFLMKSAFDNSQEQQPLNKKLILHAQYSGDAMLTGRNQSKVVSWLPINQELTIYILKNKLYIYIDEKMSVTVIVNL